MIKRPDRQDLAYSAPPLPRKRSLRLRRKGAGWDDDERMRLIGFQFYDDRVPKPWRRTKVNLALGFLLPTALRTRLIVGAP